MKYLSIIIIFLLSTISFHTIAQEKSDSATVIKKISVVTKNDDSQYTGYIIKNDEHEVVIETKNLGKVAIPKHEIKEIKEINNGEFKNGEFLGNNAFSTRYFYSNNALPINKGENYSKIGVLGPDVEFGVSKNLTLGIMASWIGSPIIAGLKYSEKISENVHIGVGTMVGSLSWFSLKTFGFMGYGVITIGDCNDNINFGAAYSKLNFAINYPIQQYGANFYSVGAMKRIGKKFTLIGDSFIYLEKKGYTAIIIPGLRYSSKENRAFQFGLAGIMSNYGVFPIPFPMVTFFNKL